MSRVSIGKCIHRLIAFRSRRWLRFLLPPQEQEQSVLHDAGMSTPPPAPQNAEAQDPPGMASPPASPSPKMESPPSLRRMLDETADLIDSPMFSHVLTLVLDATFSQLADTRLRTEAYNLPLQVSETASAARITDVTEADPADASAKLATILAVMTREAHKIGNGVPNEYVQAIEGVTELEGFGAVIYSSNFEFEAGLDGDPSPDTSRSTNGVETGHRRSGSEDVSATGVEEVIPVEDSPGMLGRATGVVDATLAGFESAWAKVIGRG